MIHNHQQDDNGHALVVETAAEAWTAYSSSGRRDLPQDALWAIPINCCRPVEVSNGRCSQLLTWYIAQLSCQVLTKDFLSGVIQNAMHMTPSHGTMVSTDACRVLLHASKRQPNHDLRVPSKSATSEYL